MPVRFWLIDANAVCASLCQESAIPPDSVEALLHESCAFCPAVSNAEPVVVSEPVSTELIAAAQPATSCGSPPAMTIIVLSYLVGGAATGGRRSPRAPGRRAPAWCVAGAAGQLHERLLDLHVLCRVVLVDVVERGRCLAQDVIHRVDGLVPSRLSLVVLVLGQVADPVREVLHRYPVTVVELSLDQSVDGGDVSRRRVVRTLGVGVRRLRHDNFPLFLAVTCP